MSQQSGYEFDKGLDSETAQAALKPGRTPIVYFVFRRPRHTRETFAPIRAYSPSKLFIIADGPRISHPEDIEACNEVIEIVSGIDWPCEVRHNFSESNLGLGKRIQTGLDWAFSFVDRAIILEDDCLASPEFFSFCDVLLERYRDSEAVWVVSGNSYQPQFKRGDASYFFSNYPDTWGWATWRRAWCHYQHNLPFLGEWQRSQRWKECFPTVIDQLYFEHQFKLSLSGKVDTWDYQWIACLLNGGGLSATPNANLVKNIGFDTEGTHTNSPNTFEYQLTSLGTLVHPSSIIVDVEADEYLRRAVRRKSYRWLVRLFFNRLRKFLLG